MIKIIKSNKNELIIKQYPLNHWLVCGLLFILVVFFNYHIFFQSPISSTLTCNKGLFNTNNCELNESALLKKNLTHKLIKNINHPKKRFASRNNAIYLKTEYANMKIFYYPSSWIIDPFLDRTDRQVAKEVDQLNDFINSWNSNQKLVIKRKVPHIFFILIWLLFIFTTPLPIFIVFIAPITIYFFDLHNNSFAINETILFSSKEKGYALSKLKIASLIKNQEQVISLKTNEDKTYIFNNFINETEAFNLFELLKKIVAIKTKVE